jgi:hypothetical protein
MRREIASFNKRQPDKALIRKIGVHKGAAIARRCQVMRIAVLAVQIGQR